LVLLVASALATFPAQFLGTGAEQELVASAPLDQVPHTIGRWSATDEPIPEEITSMLTYDAAAHRVYRDRMGYEVHVWMIFWTSRNMVKGYHHPDVCWPNRGFRLTRRDVIPVPAGGGTLPITVREFAGKNTDRQLILYWTQEGRRVWTEEEEARVQAAGDSHDWLGERLFRREPTAATGRLVVLIGTPVWGDGETIRAQTLDFATRLADEVYRLCPWAAPPGND
jgi:EpsI family protein